MDDEIFRKLPPYQKKTMENFYRRMLKNEITHEYFLGACKGLLGDVVFNQVFPFNHLEEALKKEGLQNIKPKITLELNKLNPEYYQKSKSLYWKVGENIEIETDEFLNYHIFSAFITEIAYSKSINVDQGVIKFLFLTLRYYMRDIVEKLDVSSILRVDSGLYFYNLPIKNDIKRQLWFLNEKEKNDKCKLKEIKTLKFSQERDDLNIKRRLSNSAALNALGSRRKSWMDIDITKESALLPLYSPNIDSNIEHRILNRRITMNDLRYVFERDKMYSKSVFTTYLYWYYR
ncbi:hypothetical protein DMUE_1628 [Dictyocoela muelleri]|nr:hypothetical protein DMUE_1628 [Dictyocoela muelleri]